VLGNKSFFRRAGFCAVLAVFSGCGFIDLRPIGYVSFPEHAETVLSGEKVGIRFDTDMDRRETEKAFFVSRDGISVKGDVNWNGRELSFVPLEGWKAGPRYILNLAGTIFALDGREARAALYVPFYAPARAELPYLVSFSPLDGESVGTDPEQAPLLLNFSVPMDRLSTEDALNISGISERETRWLDGDRALEVLPAKKLSPWTVYRWTLGPSAMSREGAPLAKEAGASFITDADRLVPCVIEVCPLVDTGSLPRWQRTGLALENGLGSGQAIGICFNKPMDETVSTSVRFDPVFSGRFERWDDSSVVFIPDRDPEPETVYTLIVSPGAQDVSGLKTGVESRFYFTPDIPYLTILLLQAGDPPEEYALPDPDNNSVCPAFVVMPGGAITLSLRFSHLFTSRARADAVLALRLEPYFPGILPQPALRSARWWSDDTLILDWEGAVPGYAGEGGGQRHYYRLVLPGGRGGINDGRGSYLKEEYYFILEAVDE
jgi:hypothetical protein